MNKKIYKSKTWQQADDFCKDIFNKASNAKFELEDLDLVDNILKTAFEKYRLEDIITVAAHVGRRFGEDSYNLIDKDGKTYSDPDLAKNLILCNQLSIVTQVLQILENNHMDWADRSIETDTREKND
jgi:hypothetical protein